jgi:signal transduction histidine kinase
MQKSQNRTTSKRLSPEPAAVLRKEGRPKKVLLIDGEYREAYPVYEVMTEGTNCNFDLEYTDQLSVGLERLARGGIDVLLLAPSVSDSNDLNSPARRRARSMGVPVVTLSALDDEANEIEVLKKGSREYLAKRKAYGDQLVRSINRAITRQRLASEKAPQSRWPESVETRLHNIIKSIPDGVIIVDRRGIVRFVNPAVESLFKCKAERLLGETLDLLPMVEGGKTELGIVREDGKKGTAEIRMVETRYRGELAYLISMRDITQRKKAEAKMKATIEAAEARAAAAKESAEAEIKSVKEAAEAKIKAVEEAAEARVTAAEEAAEARATAAEEAAEARATTAEKDAQARATTAEESAQARAADAEEAAEARVTAAEEAAQAAKAASEEAVASAEESARLAWEETEAIKTSSQEAIAKAEEEARIAREETEAIKKSSQEAVAKAEEEASIAREEANKAKTASEVAIARAEEQARIITEEAITAKNTAQETIDKAEEHARVVREEAVTAKLTAQEAVARAEKEARLAREDAEAARIAMQEALAKAEKETETTRTTAEEAVARAEEEARIAREETEAIKVASQEAIAKAEEEVRLAREESEAVKTASQEAITRAEEEVRLAREDAEAARATAQESITSTEKKAKTDKKSADDTVARLEKELRSIDPMQSEFMSSIVHEMRAPLHSITGFTRLVLEGGAPDPETQQEFLNIIADQSEHLRRLVDDLVDISPTASGHSVNLQKERLSIKDLLQNAVKEIYSVARQKNIVLKQDIPESLPEIDADSQRLRQVMSNLLGNAIKFSDKGGRVSVKAEAGNNDLLVQVTDQGIGIARDAMPYIFDKYYKVENMASAGGLGLGLYISKQIIEAHGGKIWAESTEGNGSTFSFTLPLKRPDR